MKTIFFGTVLALFSISAGANELLITPSMAKRGGSSFSIDFVSDGSAVALQYNIALPKGVAPEQVNLKSCAVDLPSQYVGQCSVAKNQIIGFVVNDSNEPFPAGLLPIGKVTISGADLGKLNVLKLEVADHNAKVLPSSVNIQSTISK